MREGHLETWRPSTDTARMSLELRDLGLRVRRAGSEIRAVYLPCPSRNQAGVPSRSRDLPRSAETVSESHLSRRTESSRLCGPAIPSSLSTAPLPDAQSP